MEGGREGGRVVYQAIQDKCSYLVDSAANVACAAASSSSPISNNHRRDRDACTHGIRDGSSRLSTDRRGIWVKVIFFY